TWCARKCPSRSWCEALTPGQSRSLEPPSPSAPVPRPLPPFPLLLAAQPRIRADCGRAQSALKLAPAFVPLLREVARRERSIHRTVRLAAVRAVVEPALRGEILDVGERFVHPA